MTNNQRLVTKRPNLLAGSSQTLIFSEDTRRPQTNGTIILVSFAITGALETAPVIGVVLGSHDFQSVLGNDSPIETFLPQSLPLLFLQLVSLSIAIAIFNACVAGFVGIGRNVFARVRTRLFAEPINKALLKMRRLAAGS